MLTAAKVRHVRFVTGGDLDVGNGDGLMVLRMLLAVATNESSTKSRRVKRKMLQNAEAGLPHGGHQRPFGYNDNRVIIRPDKAQTTRTLADRFLAGESVRSLARWLDEQGIPTVSGKPWRTPTLGALLASGRIAGLRNHQGEVIGKAVWEPIISEQPRSRILSRCRAENQRPAQPPPLPAVRPAALPPLPAHPLERCPRGRPPLRLLLRKALPKYWDR